jgi:hypothetical protein
MKKINQNWNTYKDTIKELYDKLNYGIDNLKGILGIDTIGRRITSSGYFSKVNKSLLECLLYYFSNLSKSDQDTAKDYAFKKDYEIMLTSDPEFNDSLSRATKDLERYRIRFSKIETIIQNAYGVKIRNIFP